MARIAGTQIASLFAAVGLDLSGAVRGLKELEDRLGKTERKVSAAKTPFEKAFLGVAGGAATAVTAVAGLTAAVTALAASAAPLANIQAAFDNLSASAGTSGDVMLDALKKASSGMMTSKELMLNYNLAAQLVSKTFATQLPEAMGLLQRVAASTGQSMSYMMESMIRGIGRLSPLILDNLGIQIDLNEAYEEYAKKTGLAADSLTKTQQQTAVAAVVMKKLRENVGALPSVSGSVAAKMSELRAKIMDAKDEIGLAFLPALNTLIDTLLGLADDWLPRLVEAMESIAPAVERATKSVQSFFENIAERRAKVEDFPKQLAQAFRESGGVMTEEIQAMIEAQKQLAAGRDMWGLGAAAIDQMAKRAQEAATWVASLSETERLAREAAREMAEAMNEPIDAFAMFSEEAELFGMSASFAISQASATISADMRKMLGDVRSTMSGAFDSLSSMQQQFNQSFVQADRDAAIARVTTAQDMAIRIMEIEAQYRADLFEAQRAGDVAEIAQLEHKHAQELRMLEYSRAKDAYLAERARHVEAIKRAQAYIDELNQLRSSIGQKIAMKMVEQVEAGKIDAETVRIKLKMLGIEMAAETDVALAIAEINRRKAMNEWELTRETWKAVNARINAYRADAEARLAAATGSLANIPLPQMPEIPPLPELLLPDVSADIGKEKTETVTETLERTVSRITDVIGAAIDTLQRLASYKARNLAAGMQALSDDIVLAVRTLYDAMTRAFGADTWKDIAEKTSLFASSASQVMSLFSSAYDIVRGLSDHVSVDVADKLSDLAVVVERIIKETDVVRARFEDADGQWQEIPRRVAQFAVYATDAVSFILPATEALKALAEYGERAAEESMHVRSGIDWLYVHAGWLLGMARGLTDAWGEIAGEINESARTIGDTISPMGAIVSTLRAIGEFGEKAGGYMASFGFGVEQLAGWAGHVLQSMRGWVVAWGEIVSEMKDSAKSVGDAISPMSTVVSTLRAVGEFGTKAAELMASFGFGVAQLAGWAGHILSQTQEFVRAWGPVADELGDGAKAIGETLSPFASIAQAVTAVAEFGTKAAELMASFGFGVAQLAGWAGHILSQTQEFVRAWGPIADELGGGAKAIGETLSPFAAIVQAVTAVGEFGAKAAELMASFGFGVEQLVGWAGHVLSQSQGFARAWGAIAAEIADSAKAIGEAIAPLSTVADTISALGDFALEGAENAHMIPLALSILHDQINFMMPMLRRIAPAWGEIAKDLKDGMQAIGAALAPISGITQALAAIGAYTAKMRPSRGQIDMLMRDLNDVIDAMSEGLKNVSVSARGKFASVSDAIGSINTAVSATIGTMQGLKEMGWRRLSYQEIQSFIGNLQHIISWLSDPETGLPALDMGNIALYASPMRDLATIVDSVVQSVRAIQSLPYTSQDKLSNFTAAIAEVIRVVGEAAGGQNDEWTNVWSELARNAGTTFYEATLRNLSFYQSAGAAAAQAFANGFGGGAPAAGGGVIARPGSAPYYPALPPGNGGGGRTVTVNVNMNGTWFGTEAERVAFVRSIKATLARELAR